MFQLETDCRHLKTKIDNGCRRVAAVVSLSKAAAVYSFWVQNINKISSLERGLNDLIPRSLQCSHDFRFFIP